jgi:hypothetical protein
VPSYGVKWPFAGCGAKTTPINAVLSLIDS